MAEKTPVKKKHKEWRKEVKKLRRKKIRQKHAEERNKTLAEEEAKRLKDPEYQIWLQQQEEQEALQLEQDEQKRLEQEELWMRRELLAEKKFREQQRKQEATVAAKEAERLRIQKEFEKIQQEAQKRREERRLREEQSKREHEQMLERIAHYVEFGGEIPEELVSNVQSNPSKPICPFFSKTNACRFGIHCSRNHIRPKLSKILFFPNFFSHIRLEQNKVTEYGCDINLEYTDRELNNDYREFFEDVVEELRKFGEIENFRTCMNSQPHLRGNVLVEFKQERDALGAYMKLQGRYYASRRINVEFSSIVTWKSAICGLSYTSKCPKARNCNYLHIFRNPGNVYNTPIFRRDESQRRALVQRSVRDNSVASWNDGIEGNSARNWRWSESPERVPQKNYLNDDRKASETSLRGGKESPATRSDQSREKEDRRRIESPAAGSNHSREKEDRHSRPRSRRENGSSTRGNNDTSRVRSKSGSQSQTRSESESHTSSKSQSQRSTKSQNQTSSQSLIRTRGRSRNRSRSRSKSRPISHKRPHRDESSCRSQKSDTSSTHYSAGHSRKSHKERKRKFKSSRSSS